MASAYLFKIDEKIAALQKRIDELKVAKRVLATLHDETDKPVHKPAPVLNALTVKVKRRQSFGKHGTMYARTRTAVMKVLEAANKPMLSRDIIIDLKDHLATGDSTVWKCLKELRDSGVIAWDEETRVYSLIEKKVAVAS